MEKTFKHSGDLGDIIYSLVAIKRLGGGILYLDTTGGESDQACKMQCLGGKTSFNKDSYNYLYPLLKAQPYIYDVKEWNGENCDYNLNKYRIKFNDGTCKTTNLIDNQLDSLNLPLYTDHNEPWLVVRENIKLDRNIILTRTPRYQSNYTWFLINKYNIEKTAIFVGLPKEHEYFEWTFKIKVPYYEVKDALEMAKILAGCETFICNATSTLAIAIGLGTVPIVQEVDPRCPSCVFKGKSNMTYI